MENISRRNFLGTLVVGGAAVLSSPQRVFGYFDQLPSIEYENIGSSAKWQELQRDLYFGQIDVLRNSDIIDRISVVRYKPESYQTRVFNASKEAVQAYTIEEWQQRTGALALVNSAQYQGDPNYYHPCALMICDGKKTGPTVNRSVRGMFVAEPSDSISPKADLLDFDYDDPTYERYTQGVQHWPIILNREGKVRVKSTNWQANRTAVAKRRNGEIMLMTTEGGFFTLHNLGRFLRDCDLDIETAMPMDGGPEAQMAVKTDNFNYSTYGQFENHGSGKFYTSLDIRYEIPSVIGLFSRA